jgi:hypothetical protein
MCPLLDFFFSLLLLLELLLRLLMKMISGEQGEQLTGCGCWLYYAQT